MALYACYTTLLILTRHNMPQHACYTTGLGTLGRSMPLSICRLRVRIIYSLFSLSSSVLSISPPQHALISHSRFTINDPPSQASSSPAAAPALAPASVSAVVVDGAVR